jgi:hypothetical protein
MTVTKGSSYKKKLLKPNSASIRKLNEKEESFCRHLVYDLMTVVEAAKQAGYVEQKCNASYVHRYILNRPSVQARIEEMRRHKEYESICDRHFVLEELKKIVTTNSGTPQAVKALELLGKHINLFSENVNINVGDQASVADEVWKRRQALSTSNGDVGADDEKSQNGGSNILPIGNVKEA